MSMDRDPNREAAERLLAKVREFVASLDDDERALFATLLAPGVARAYQEDDEVVGFGEAGAREAGAGEVGWSPAALPDALVRELREQGVRVEGLTD